MRTGIAGVILSGVLCASCASSSGAPASPSPTLVPGSAPATSTVVMRRVETFIPATGDAALQAFVPDVAPTETGGECSIQRTGGSGATIASIGFPTRRAAETSISISFDSAGHLIRYSERRGGLRQITTAGMTVAQRDSVMRTADDAARSTSIYFDYAIDQAILTNRGGGRPTNAVLGTVRAAEQLEKLGPTRARMERARRLCGV